MAKNTTQKTTEEKVATQTTTKEKKVNPKDKIAFDVLADIRLPALNMQAKKGDEIELTQAQAAFFIHSGQIKRK